MVAILNKRRLLLSTSILVIMVLSFSLLSFASQSPLETVKQVDLSKYAGKWYEIASFPQRFQKGCTCTTAEYTVEKDHVKVRNECHKDSPQGKLSGITGKAFAVEGTGNAKLKVQFFWPFKADYWIIDLDEKNYSYAVVGHPNRQYLWILSRTPKMDKGLYDAIVSRAKAKGFQVQNLKVTVQACN